MFLAGDPVAGLGVPVGIQNIQATRPGTSIGTQQPAIATPQPTYGGYQVGPFILPELPVEDPCAAGAANAPAGADCTDGATYGSTWTSAEADQVEMCDTNDQATLPIPRPGYMFTYTDPSQIPDALRAHLSQVIFDNTLMHPALSGGRTSSGAEMGNYYHLDDPSEVSFFGGTQNQLLDAGPWWLNTRGFDITKAPWWNRPKLASSYRGWMDSLGIGDQAYNLAMISMAAPGVYPWNTFGPLMSGIPIMTYRGPYLGAISDPDTGNEVTNPGMSIWDPSQWSPLDYPDVWPDSSVGSASPDPTTNLTYAQRPWMEWAVFLRLRPWGGTYSYYKTGAPIFGCSSCYPVPDAPLDSFFVLDVIFMPTREWYNYAPNACIDVAGVLPKFWLGLGLWTLQNLCQVADTSAVIGALNTIGKGTPGKNPKTGKPTPPVPNPYASAAAALMPLLCSALGKPAGSTPTPTPPVPVVAPSTGPPWGTILVIGGILIGLALVMRSTQ